jgi:hypothetical protein
MRSGPNHFDDDDYQSEIDSYIYSGDREDHPLTNWRNLDGDRFYLSESDDNLRRFISDREAYIDEINEIYDGIVEADMDEIAAYWHEKEESL